MLLSFIALKNVSSMNLISNCTGLMSMNQTGPNMLANSISCTGVNFVPISSFWGMLDGQGYSIINVTITGINASVGLFSTVNNGTVCNVVLVNFRVISNSSNVGALFGQASFPTKLIRFSAHQ